MNILIISGFLGAGKTTFIKEMCRRVKSDFVVMENDFGGINVDSAVLKEDSKMNIWELTEGCICCSMKTNFADSVLTVANSLNPEVLIVEPSGVGVLSNVISNLKQIEYEHIKLLAPVTIIDANSFSLHTDETRQIFKDQIKYAGKVLFSKTDSSGSSIPDNIINAVKEINPKADILTEHYSNMDKKWWEDILNTKISGEKIKPDIQNAVSFDNFTVKNSFLHSFSEAAVFIENIIRGRYGNIIRAKGFIECKEEILRFDVVDGKYAITGFDGNVDSPSAVFIGTDIDKDKIKNILAKPIKIKGTSRKKIKI